MYSISMGLIGKCISDLNTQKNKKNFHRLIVGCFLVFFSLPGSSDLFAQQSCNLFTDNVWYFGAQKQGIVFTADNSGVMTPHDASGLSLVSTFENSVVVSGPSCNGANQLIFYADANTLYDATHSKMPNSSFVGSRFTADGLQACFIGNNKYMLLGETNAYETNNGPSGMALKSYIVDMSANGGLGDQIPAASTTIESAGMSESTELIAVPGTSNAYWLIYYHFGAQEMRVREVANGVVGPVISSVPYTLQMGQNGRTYMLNSNVQHSQLALMVSQDNTPRVALFDFDIATGAVSFSKDINTGFAANAGYDVQFSPNNQYLYVSTWISSVLQQYDLVNNTWSPVFNVDGTNGSSHGGGMKYGPDGRLYVANSGSYYVGVIPAPDAPLTAGGYIANGFKLNVLSPNSMYPPDNGFIKFSTGLTAPGVCPDPGLIPNRPPVTVDDIATMCFDVDAVTKVNVVTNDSDPDGDVLKLVNADFAVPKDSLRLALSYNSIDSTIMLTPKTGAAFNPGEEIDVIYTVRDNSNNPLPLCNQGILRLSLRQCSFTTLLKIKKTANVSNVKPGDNVVFTISVQNTGTKDTTGVLLTDVPKGFTYVNDNGNGSFDPSTMVWNAGAVEAGAVAKTLQITMQAKETGEYLNIAVGGDGDPKNPVNPQDTVKFKSFVTWKSVSDASGDGKAQAGEELTYIINVRNIGTVQLNNIVVNDIIPVNTSYISGGTYNSGTNSVSFNGTTLAAGATTSYSFVVKVATDLTGINRVSNQAIVVVDDIPSTPTKPADPADPSNPDPSCGDVAGCATDIPVQGVESFITWKSVSDAGGDGKAQAGENLTYTINVKNTGTVQLKNITVSDIVPAHTSYVSGGIYNNGTNTVSFNGTNLSIGASASYNFVVKVNNDLTGINKLSNQAIVVVDDIPSTPTKPADPADPSNPDPSCTDISGCPTDIPLQDKFHIPNVITPNGDGYNDLFVIQGTSGYDQLQITIFNRWNNVVYQNSMYQNNWDGNGLNAGTYFYVVKALSKASHQWEVYKGWILIMR